MDNRKFITVITLGVITFGVVASPAAACHRFSKWYYPWAQRCVVNPHPGKYYVEITQTKQEMPLPSLEPAKPAELDLRTPDQIQEQKDHDEMVRKHHDEINALMKLLHGEGY